MLSPGQLYTADMRGLRETDGYRRHSIFNYADYQGMHREPFGLLSVFNDEFLAARHSISFTITDDCYFLLIPITGAITCNNLVAEAGQLYLSRQSAGGNIELKNDYPADWVNFIYLQIKAPVTAYQPKVFDFDMEGNINRLTNMLPDAHDLPFKLHIGLFGGREEELYRLQSDKSLLFAYVLSGAFEFQGRLMHQRDALALWSLHEVDLEALSNNAVVLVLEM